MIIGIIFSAALVCTGLGLFLYIFQNQQSNIEFLDNKLEDHRRRLMLARLYMDVRPDQFSYGNIDSLYEIAAVLSKMGNNSLPMEDTAEYRIWLERRFESRICGCDCVAELQTYGCEAGKYCIHNQKD